MSESTGGAENTGRGKCYQTDCTGHRNTNIFESNDIMTDRRLEFMKNISSNLAQNYFLPMKTCILRPNHNVEHARVNSRGLICREVSYTHTHTHTHTQTNTRSGFDNSTWNKKTGVTLTLPVGTAQRRLFLSPRRQCSLCRTISSGEVGRHQNLLQHSKEMMKSNKRCEIQHETLCNGS